MAPLLHGKTFLVTGSTDGIGRNTVHKLAAAGANIILHGRDSQKLAVVKQECTQSAQAGSSCSTFTCDFSSLADVRRFAEEVKAEHARIDVLVNNAGIFSKQRTLSNDGYELTWAVNALAPFLLTSLLLDRVKERIVNVGSAALASHIDLDNLQQEKNFTGYGAYAQSKLANLMFSAELAPRLESKRVTVNCVHPGVHRTKVLNDGWGSGVGDVKGADDVFNLSVGKEFGQQTGKFYGGQGPMQVPGCAQDKALLKQLFQVMQEQTGAEF